jgi:3',5'-cyclic AMP phosphodiesterase CpdA
MKFFSSKIKKFTALALSLAFLFSAIPAGVFSALTSVQKAPLQIAVMADIHHYPQVYMGDKGAAWQKFCDDTSRQFTQSNALIDAALSAITLHAQSNGCKYVLIPGDLTKDSEYEGHLELAARLERFELETGIQVFVVNGNHDINNSQAATFENGKLEPARATTPEEFRLIYANLGYDLATNTYTPPAGQKAGMLSYSAPLDGGYRLIVLDGGKYSNDSTSDGEDEHETGGNITPELMAWALAEMADAKSRGETVIGMSHHSIVKQFEIQPSLLQDFTIDNWLETAETFADAGMRYVFTGHSHSNNMASHVSDNGNALYDCQTASLTGFPNNFREVLFDNTDSAVKATINTFDVDCEQKIVAEGIAYEKPYKYTYSFGQTYGKNSLAGFGAGMADGFVSGFFEGIKAQGGLYAMMTGAGFDLEGVIDDAIQGGITFGSYDVFTVRNIMSFVEDLAKQIDALFIENPQTVIDIAYEAADKLVSMQVSDYPCTAFLDTIGFGDPAKPGTLEDAAYSVIAYMYEGDEDISGDLFMQDTLDFFRNRDGAGVAYQTIKDVLINDLIQGSILNVLNFNPGTLFPQGSFGAVMGKILDAVIGFIFPNDRTFLNIINSILGFLPVEYNSLENVVDTVAQEYLTQSQLDSVGYTIAEIIESMVVDEDPGFMMDRNVTIINKAPAPVIATAENYRLPSRVAVTFGDKADSTRNITWYTKYSVTGTDIELLPYTANPVFTGNPSTEPGIIRLTEKVVNSFPGVDLGIAGFLNYEFNLVRHNIKLTQLNPGQKYIYRVGDAARGWWSQPGIIETADNSDAFTFFHMTDPQSQNIRQYGAWSNTVKTAFGMFPQSKFIMSSGDLVDNHINSKQWKWLLDTAADNLMSTALMTTAGNHEHKDYTLDENFLLPAAHEQDRNSGVYYSFDYNNAHFIVLNTNDLSSKNDLSAEQLAWLKKDAAQSTAQWKILSLHKAIYSNGSHYDDKDVVALRKQLSSLLPELGIDLVLQGHDHVYLRTDAMNNNKVAVSETKNVSYQGLDYRAKIEPEGSVYVISGCAGVKNYLTKSPSATDKLFPRAESLVPIDTPMFSAIQIVGSALYFDAYSVDEGDTKRIDSFAIKKAPIAENPGPNDDADNQNDTEPGYTDNEEIPQTGSSNIVIYALIPLAASFYLLLITKKKNKQI